MIGNNWLRIVFGIATGGLLGFVNYWLMSKSITQAADPIASIRKSSFLRFLLIFLGLLLAIRLGAVAGLVSAALAMLVLTWIGLLKIAKKLAAEGGESNEQ